jgi:hypothetical protein
MRTIRLCYRARQRILLDPRQPLGQLDARHPCVRCRQRIELVPTPTYASYLNRIESHFRPIQEFVFNNTDYLDRANAQRALADHITDRNGPDPDRRIAALQRRHRIAA